MPKNIRIWILMRIRNNGKKPKKSQMMEGSGTGAGSVPLTNGFGCGSGMPQNIRMRIWNNSKNSQNRRNKVFLTNFAWWWKDPEPNPYLWLTDPDADPGKTQNIRIPNTAWSNDPRALRYMSVVLCKGFLAASVVAKTAQLNSPCQCSSFQASITVQIAPSPNPTGQRRRSGQPSRTRT